MKEDSLHSYQFSGSQFGSPSDEANRVKANHEHQAQGAEGQGGSSGNGQGAGEWMYEDTIPEDYDEQ